MRNGWFGPPRGRRRGPYPRRLEAWIVSIVFVLGMIGLALVGGPWVAAQLGTGAPETSVVMALAWMAAYGIVVTITTNDRS